MSDLPASARPVLLPPDVDAALYRELIPIRPTGKPDTFLGPTHQWALHLERLEFDWPLTAVEDVA